MQRVVKGRSATISVTFTGLDDVGANPSPDTATVTVTNDAGTVLVSAQAATEGGTGIFTYTLTPTHTANLDLLRVDWVATVAGVAETRRTFVEVVGGHLFEIAEARLVKPLDNTTTYTAAKIADARVLAESALEEACERAFVRRYGKTTLSGNGGHRLELGARNVSSIRSITVGGTALTAAQLLTVTVDDSRYAYYPAGFTAGSANVVVAYEYGLEYPPPRVGRACLLLAKRFLVDSPIHDRATSVTTDDGTTSFFVTAGVRNAVFDIPEANAVVDEYGLRAGVF